MRKTTFYLIAMPLLALASFIAFVAHAGNLYAAALFLLAFAAGICLVVTTLKSKLKGSLRIFLLLTGIVFIALPFDVVLAALFLGFEIGMWVLGIDALLLLVGLMGSVGLLAGRGKTKSEQLPQASEKDTDEASRMFLLVNLMTAVIVLAGAHLVLVVVLCPYVGDRYEPLMDYKWEGFFCTSQVQHMKDEAMYRGYELKAQYESECAARGGMYVPTVIGERVTPFSPDEWTCAIME